MPARSVEPLPTPAAASVSGNPFGEVRLLAWVGLAVIVLFFGVGGAWSFLAPLESAALATGYIEAESSRKSIQHLEGGIIREILVKDGDAVRQGDVLLRLDPTKARSELAVLHDQLLAQQIREARLVAEREGGDKITWPAAVQARAADPAIAQALASESKLFDIRTALQRAKIHAAVKRREESQAQIPGQKAVAEAAAKQITLYHEEEAGVRQLLDQGLASKPRLLAIQRAIADAESRRADSQAQVSRLVETVAENEVTIASIQRDRESEVADQLRQTEVKLNELGEQVRAAQDRLDRTEIRAPQDGTVTDLRVHTTGGVINPGEAIMDLMPRSDRLVARVQLRPEEINYVREGLSATVRLPAYRQRAMPMLLGRVSYVSPDRLTDKKTDKPYYAATIVLDASELSQLNGVEIKAGMEAEAMIKTGSTRVAFYALSPILDSFRKAFRER